MGAAKSEGSRMNTYQATVLHEEIIVHPTVECLSLNSKGMIGTARIMGSVEINGILYKFERVVPIRFVRDTVAQHRKAGAK
jgi:hypothetical protein